MPQRFRVDDALHVGVDSISARKVCGGLCLPRASDARPYRPFAIVCSPLSARLSPLSSLLTPNSSLISQPVILQPPLQFRLVGYKNALLQG